MLGLLALWVRMVAENPNIVDALVWVMGEMSAKDLRGSQMTGCDLCWSWRLCPMGMAEVSLTLENDGGLFQQSTCVSVKWWWLVVCIANGESGLFWMRNQPDYVISRNFHGYGSWIKRVFHHSARDRKNRPKRQKTEEHWLKRLRGSHESLKARKKNLKVASDGSKLGAFARYYSVNWNASWILCNARLNVRNVIAI